MGLLRKVRGKEMLGGLILDNGTATATAGAATLNKMAGVVTSEALTTAAAGTYTLTLTDNQIADGDIVAASVANGTNTAGTPVLARVTPASVDLGLAQL